MEKIKQNFVITKGGEDISFRHVIAFNESQARDLIVDHIECNWGSLKNEDGGEYEYRVYGTERIETDKESDVYA